MLPRITKYAPKYCNHYVFTANIVIITNIAIDRPIRNGFSPAIMHYFNIASAPKIFMKSRNLSPNLQIVVLFNCVYCIYINIYALYAPYIQLQ